MHGGETLGSLRAPADLCCRDLQCAFRALATAPCWGPSEGQSVPWARRHSREQCRTCVRMHERPLAAQVTCCCRLSGAAGP